MSTQNVITSVQQVHNINHFGLYQSVGAGNMPTVYALNVRRTLFIVPSDILISLPDSIATYILPNLASPDEDKQASENISRSDMMLYARMLPSVDPAYMYDSSFDTFILTPKLVLERFRLGRWDKEGTGGMVDVDRWQGLNQEQINRLAQLKDLEVVNVDFHPDMMRYMLDFYLQLSRLAPRNQGRSTFRNDYRTMGVTGFENSPTSPSNTAATATAATTGAAGTTAGATTTAPAITDGATATATAPGETGAVVPTSAGTVSSYIDSEGSMSAYQSESGFTSSTGTATSYTTDDYTSNSSFGYSSESAYSGSSFDSRDSGSATGQDSAAAYAASRAEAHTLGAMYNTYEMFGQIAMSNLFDKQVVVVLREELEFFPVVKKKSRGSNQILSRKDLEDMQYKQFLINRKQEQQQQQKQQQADSAMSSPASNPTGTTSAVENTTATTTTTNAGAASGGGNSSEESDSGEYLDPDLRYLFTEYLVRSDETQVPLPTGKTTMRHVRAECANTLLNRRRVFEALEQTLDAQREAIARGENFGKDPEVEQQLMDMLRASGFNNDSVWGCRRREPERSVLTSLVFMPFRATGETQQILAAQKLVLFWKKPARKCWWDGFTVDVDVKNCADPIEVRLWSRRIWTLELVLY
ncbi:hypothetical protein GQ42DRAFT_35192 [Ramicandelaber brevisporus]|nr:hypothetical protein GQ42DRAFT_35192 [Ramicandelaber brevisporus]